MAWSASIKWTGLGEMRVKNDNLPKLIFKLVSAVLQRQADVSTAYMKTNASWTDRTSNARNGLRAQAFGGGEEQALVLAHGVPYGIWLEVRWGGRYAIITKALNQAGPEIMRLLDKGLGRL